MRQRVRSNNNPHSDISINAIELAAHVTRFLLKTPHHAGKTHTPAQAVPHLPTWFMATNACNYNLDSVFFNSTRDIFV